MVVALIILFPISLENAIIFSYFHSAVVPLKAVLYHKLISPSAKEARIITAERPVIIVKGKNLFSKVGIYQFS